jgi:hypothetical protein
MSAIMDNPDPRTVTSIQLQGWDPDAMGIARCGCHERPIGSNHWYLCGYHEGYEDAVEAVTEEAKDHVGELESYCTWLIGTYAGWSPEGWFTMPTGYTFHRKEVGEAHHDPT